MRTFTIHPNGRWEATPLSHPDDDDSDTALLTWLQGQVGGWIEAVSGTMWVAYLNEEGKLKDLPYNPLADMWMRHHGCHLDKNDYIVGPVVFMGPPDAEGNNTDLPQSVYDSLLNYCQEW